ncbi:PKD-like family lipoprotein [Filimonas effusa]|uniref:PKD-like family protein n=1 Tax=Filimonas effusa TaxID=2508721 RepID=A0A4Q1D6J9_9BACT|nr:PKD-like family lipoprotein [Filimonas effusa]RXK83616.1 hypothetical protein ESB13_16140 [Filimonas effusa]
MKIAFKHIIAGFAGLLLLNACKKDLGNYSYTSVPVPVIDTTGIGGARFVERYGTLDINPTINYKNEGALKYQWTMHQFVAGSSGPTIPSRVLSTSRHLSALITETVGEYRLELLVTDTANALKANILFTVTVSAGLEYGVMVLHGTADSSDIDFIVTANAIPVAGINPRRLRGLYKASTGTKFPGAPRFVSQERRSFSTQNWITLGSDKHLSRVSGSDFTLLRADKQYFRRADAVIAPEALGFLANSYTALINDGKLHIYNTTYEVDGLFGGPIDGDYKLAPYVAYQSASSVLAAVYDQKYGRFLRPSGMGGFMVDFTVAPANTNAPFNHRQIGKDMLFMDRGFSGNTHSFFKDRTGNGYWLYISNFNKTDDGTLAIAAYDMTNLPEIASAKYFQTSELGYIDFYATDRKVYAYNYQGSNTATLALDNIPSGETITCMRLFKPRPNYNLTTSDGAVLYIATWNGTQGKVYEYMVNGNSGQITTPAAQVFEGFDKVADISAKGRGSGTY